MSSTNSTSMEIFKMFLGFVGIMRDTLSIFSKNGKLMASIASSIIVLNSLLYSLNVLSLRPLIKHLVADSNLLTASTDPALMINSVTTIKQDVGFLITVEWIFLFLISITSLLFATTTTVLASAITHRAGGDSMTFRNLISEAVKTWKRPLCTWFYTTLLGVGYNFIVFLVLWPTFLLIENPTVFAAIFYLTVIVASIFHAYLAVVWTLSIVVSVLEDVSGIEALGKAARIAMKGMKLHGFVLNVLIAIAGGVLVQGIRLIGRTGSFPVQMLIGLLVLNSIYLVRMFLLMAYTVFYFECKKIHGEEIELQGRMNAYEYTTIPAPPLIHEIIP